MPTKKRDLPAPAGGQAGGQAGLIERRITEGAELRIEPSRDDGPGRLVGYAAVFGKDSVDFGGWVEQVARGAFADVMDQDVRALIDHDPAHLLGRASAGTLTFRETQTGLRFACDLPDRSDARDLAESVRRGDISGCSFAFRVAEDGDEWIIPKDGPVRRIVRRIETLRDVGPVVFPAYPDTTVAMRALAARRVRPLDELRTALAAAEAARA